MMNWVNGWTSTNTRADFGNPLRNQWNAFMPLFDRVNLQSNSGCSQHRYDLPGTTPYGASTSQLDVQVRRIDRQMQNEVRLMIH